MPKPRHDAATAAVRHAAEKAAASFPALMIEAERIAQTVSAGFHGRRRAGPGETFWQHRPYAFGDSVSAIDWRQSARIADRLYVRQNEWEASAAVWIWRDASRSLNYTSSASRPTKRRRADILATALAILLSQAGERVGILNEGAPRPFHGRSAPVRFLEALEINHFDDQASNPPIAPISYGARLVVLSDFFTDIETLQSAIDIYAGNGASGVLVQVIDPAEEDFPFRGRTEFRDVEGTERRLFGDASSVATDYRTRFQAHRETLTGIAKRLGWTFIAHRTDRPPQTALLALYAALSNLSDQKQ